MQQVMVADDLAVAIGNQAVRLSPGEAFRLAERLIRSAVVRMVSEETGACDIGAARLAVRRPRAGR
jgi:hypothetical protein